MLHINYGLGMEKTIEQLSIISKWYNDIESQWVIDDIIFWKRNDLPIDVIMAVEWLYINYQLDVFTKKI